MILTHCTDVDGDIDILLDPLRTADGRAEKPARAALFTAAQRQMGPDTLLVVDSMNYIKGFRTNCTAPRTSINCVFAR